MSLSFSTQNYSEFCEILFRCYQSGNFSRTAESVVTWTRIIINFIGLFIELSCNTHTQTHRHTICEMCSSRFLGLTEKNTKNTKKKTDDNSSLRANRGASASCIDYLQQQHTGAEQKVCVCVCVCVCRQSTRAVSII